MSLIPVHNLYYLLSYAWDLLGEGDPGYAVLDDTRSAPEMLALLLAGGIETLGKRGLFQDYQSRVENTQRLKGRIDFVASLRHLQHRQASLVCHFDELGTDNEVNGILRASLDRLLGSRSLSPIVKERLRQTEAVLQAVPPAALRRGCFRRARVTRYHRTYRMALSVCELLFEIAQPDSDGRSHSFADPWAGQTMHRVFETFVRNFLRRHLPAAQVGAKQMYWDARGHSMEAQALLPLMKTDVTIDWGGGHCTVLDCKFYEHSFTRSFGEPKLDSGNLYQMAAYLHHHPLRALGGAMHGVLLYPAVDGNFLHHYDFMGHHLTVASVDLGQAWPDIHARLLNVIRWPHSPQA